MLNILGLSVGIACFILISKYVFHEFSFDRFHKNVQDIYLVYEQNLETKRYSHITPNPLASVLKADYPELKNAVSIIGTEQPVKVNQELFLQEVHMADTGFFEMFSFDLMIGSTETLDYGSHSIVVSRRFAEKHFEATDPRGEIIQLKDQAFVVTGVMGDFPSNSSIQIDLLIFPSGMLRFFPDLFSQWWSSASMTLVQLPKSTSAEFWEKQLSFIEDKYFPEYMKGRSSLGLMPLVDIHLIGETDTFLESAKPISSATLYVLAAIAVAILLIACFNFINLSISRYTERVKEVGVRKVIGANRKQLIQQFLGETSLITVLALLLGFIFATTILPYFNQLADRSLTIISADHLLSIPLLILLGVVIVLVAGCYPALYLSGFKPIIIIKAKSANTNSAGLSLRKLLVVFQFIITTILVCSVLLIKKQTQFMSAADLGFNRSNIIALELTSWQVEDNLKKLERIKGSLGSSKEALGIKAITLSENVPQGFYQNSFKVHLGSEPPESSLQMVVTSIDEHFINAYGLSLLAGRNFSLDLASDKAESVILNQTAARRLGLNELQDTSIKFQHDATPLNIIGIVEDINFQSLHHPIKPQVYRYTKGKFNTGFISVRFEGGNSTGVIQYLRKTWTDIVPELPFNYISISDEYREGYKQDIKTAQIIGAFCIVAILLACLGLLGLIALSIAQRTKEIGIRKVLGATIIQIVATTTRDFAKLVTTATLVAMPVSWYITSKWLENFAYRTELTWWTFGLAALMVVAVALFTISFRAVVAALANPVEALKTE